VVLTDPRDIRALAHPARLVVLSELRGDDERTATELAARADITPSAMSYHLRALERAGIVERGDPSGDGRERPWRSTHTGLRIESASPAATAPAEELVLAATLDGTRRAFGDYIRIQGEEPAEWRDVPAIHVSRLWLTAAEAAELSQQFEALAEPFRERRVPGKRPAGAREVETVTIIVPKAPAEPKQRRQRSPS
jgi:DNA-binding transcriptional ArsR family regulator